MNLFFSPYGLIRDSIPFTFLWFDMESLSLFIYLFLLWLLLLFVHIVSSGILFFLFSHGFIRKLILSTKDYTDTQKSSCYSDNYFPVITFPFEDYLILEPIRISISDSKDVMCPF